MTEGEFRVWARYDGEISLDCPIQGGCSVWIPIGPGPSLSELWDRAAGHLVQYHAKSDDGA